MNMNLPGPINPAPLGNWSFYKTIYNADYTDADYVEDIMVVSTLPCSHLSLPPLLLRLLVVVSVTKRLLTVNQSFDSMIGRFDAYYVSWQAGDGKRNSITHAQLIAFAKVLWIRYTYI